MIGRPAEFTIGRKPQTDTVLQAHRLFDGLILGRGQRDQIDLAARKATPRFEQRRRPQQAADMLGTKWEISLAVHQATVRAAVMISVGFVIA